jgi:hypothetical protein
MKIRNSHRRGVLLGAGAVSLVLAATGIVAAMAMRSTPRARGGRPSHAVSPNAIGGAAPRSQGSQASNNNGSSSAPSTTSSSSTTAGLELADGTYPTYIRQVDADGAKLTIDVLQVFQGQAAIDAAVEDGVSPNEAKYLYVYIRNQNSRLRTLPVARDVDIDFVGTCESPPNREAALTELAEETTPFDTTYYYDVTVDDGVIHGIAQRLAIAAC